MAAARSLFLSVQYPQSIGPLGEDKLDTLLRAIQKVTGPESMILTNSFFLLLSSTLGPGLLRLCVYTQYTDVP